MKCYLCVAKGIHFRYTNWCSCESVKVFETEDVLTWEGLETPTFGFMSNVLTIWAISAGHLLSHVFKHRLWLYRYFWCKVNIWNVNCARATAFIFDTRMGVLLWQCQSFWDRKCLDLRGTRNPSLGIHAEFSNHLSYKGRTFAVPCFQTPVLVVQIFLK